MQEQEKGWLEDLAKGSEQALRQIFDRHYPILLNDIHRIVPDEESCKDIAQEVFVELWKIRANLDIKIALRPYLKRAALNRALNFVKIQKRYQFEANDEFFESSEPAEHQIQEAHAERQNLETALHAAIQNLPEKCRLVFSLSRFEELSHKEIAARLDISTKTIENQITKALKMLREALAERPDLSAIVIFALGAILK